MFAGRCQLCGKPFLKEKPAKFCKKACRQAAYRDRHRPADVPPTIRKGRRPRVTEQPAGGGTMAP